MAAPIVLREALEAFDVYLAGETDDGTFLYSRDPRTPIDDTVVWVGNKSDELMTVLEAEDRFNEVYWRMEPELVTAPARVAAFGADDAPVDIVKPPEVIEDEAVQDERNGLVEEAETRVSELEAMVADLMLGSLTDMAFDVGAPDQKVEIEEAKVASLGRARSTLGEVANFCARIAAVQAAPDEDIDSRLQAVIARLDALEERLAELLGEAFDDEELPADERDSSMNTVDETAPKVAAAAVVDEELPPVIDDLVDIDLAPPLISLNDLLRMRRGEEIIIDGVTYQSLGVGMFRSADGAQVAARTLATR